MYFSLDQTDRPVDTAIPRATTLAWLKSNWIIRYDAKRLSSCVQTLKRHADVSWRWPVAIFRADHKSLSFCDKDQTHFTTNLPDFTPSSPAVRGQGQRADSFRRRHTHVNPLQSHRFMVSSMVRQQTWSRAAQAGMIGRDSIEPFLLMNLIFQCSIMDVP